LFNEALIKDTKIRKTESQTYGSSKTYETALNYIKEQLGLDAALRILPQDLETFKQENNELPICFDPHSLFLKIDGILSLKLDPNTNITLRWNVETVESVESSPDLIPTNTDVDPALINQPSKFTMVKRFKRFFNLLVTKIKLNNSDKRTL